MRTAVGIFVLMLISMNFCFSQAYRPRDEVIVMFHATITKKDSGFVYYYKVTSKENSVDVFETFSLFVVDSFLTNNVTIVSEPKNKKWYIDGDNSGFVTGTASGRLLGVPSSDGLSPGESMTFSFVSAGLPSIMTYYAQSTFFPLSEDELDSLRTLGYTDEQLFPDWKEDSYKNQTVAPNTNFSNLTLLTFLDTLLSYTRQSVQLGWLKTTRDDDCNEDEQPNNGIARNIEKRIEKAKRELIKGDSLKARKELEKLVKKVEKIFKKSEELENAALRHPVEREKKRENEITLTSEAYALLKYNAEYLIERLPEKKKKQ